MSAPSDRRGFLRGLVSLPLIGGGVTLIGSPSAVAEPISRALLWEYETWLSYEHQRVAEMIRPKCEGRGTQFFGPAHDWHYDRQRGEYLNGDPSTRAALVLATVGCDWRKNGR